LCFIITPHLLHRIPESTGKLVCLALDHGDRLFLGNGSRETPARNGEELTQSEPLRGIRSRAAGVEAPLGGVDIRDYQAALSGLEFKREARSFAKK
jgi:hypothetical protein